MTSFVDITSAESEFFLLWNYQFCSCTLHISVLTSFQRVSLRAERSGKSSLGHLECRWSSCGSSSCWRRSLSQHPELLRFSALMVLSSSCPVPSNEHSKRDDGWLIFRSTKWSKQKRRWVAHVAFHPISKSKEEMVGSCHVPSNEYSKRDDGWLMSCSTKWSKQKRHWAAHVTFNPMIKIKEPMGGSFRIPPNDQSKRDDGWLISHSTKWSKQKRRWLAHVAFHPMVKAKEPMGNWRHIQSNEQNKRDDGWLESHTIQWA
jgi:hypothetical protein